MLRSGVVAIVGPTDPKVAAHVQAMSDVFRIPHIETRFKKTSIDFTIFAKSYFI